MYIYIYCLYLFPSFHGGYVMIFPYFVCDLKVSTFGRWRPWFDPCRWKSSPSRSSWRERACWTPWRQGFHGFSGVDNEKWWWKMGRYMGNIWQWWWKMVMKNADKINGDLYSIIVGFFWDSMGSWSDSLGVYEQTTYGFHQSWWLHQDSRRAV